MVIHGTHANVRVRQAAPQAAQLRDRITELRAQQIYKM
jgi:hypothetical protein